MKLSIALNKKPKQNNKKQKTKQQKTGGMGHEVSYMHWQTKKQKKNRGLWDMKLCIALREKDAQRSLDAL
jgi:hypothetical protein